MRDDETGLYQVRARYYSPTLRRFISEDPSGLSAGINQFAYGGNDPINFSDPTGLDRCYITYETRTESGVLLGTYRESVPCPQEGSSISDSPWGDPTIPITSISTVTVALTMAKIARAQSAAAKYEKCATEVGFFLVSGAADLAGAGALKAGIKAFQSIRSQRALASMFARGSLQNLTHSWKARVGAINVSAYGASYVQGLSDWNGLPMQLLKGQIANGFELLPIVGTGIQAVKAYEACFE